MKRKHRYFSAKRTACTEVLGSREHGTCAAHGRKRTQAEWWETRRG